MLATYLLGSAVCVLLGYLLNRSNNYVLRLPLGIVLVLAILSWGGVIAQLIILLTQLDFKWFNPKDIHG